MLLFDAAVKWYAVSRKFSSTMIPKLINALSGDVYDRIQTVVRFSVASCY